MNHRAVGVRRWPTVPLLLVALTGCGGNAPAPVPAGPPTDDLRLGLQDYRLQLSAAALLPGTVTVTATNTGSDRHDVTFTQDGAVIGRTEVLPPGGRETVQMQVDPGSEIQLECTVAGHAAAGMTASMSVAR